MKNIGRIAKKILEDTSSGIKLLEYASGYGQNVYPRVVYYTKCLNDADVKYLTDCCIGTDDAADDIEWEDDNGYYHNITYRVLPPDIFEGICIPVDEIKDERIEQFFVDVEKNVH